MQNNLINELIPAQPGLKAVLNGGHMNGEDYLDLDKDIAEVDPDTNLIIDFEAEKQARKIILIPSESIAPRAVRQALGSVFTNKYAEGYPSLRMTKEEEKGLLDYSKQMAYYRRYANRRYYKGCDYVDLIEVLAQRRIANVFATENFKADELFVNVQPLSGAAANNAVYEALINVGDTVLGMSLSHGGHLTHGSEFNRSGKNYNIVSYGVNPNTGKIDYEDIKQKALEHKPRMIIGGGSAYPWDIDWSKLREIADLVNAYLLADISHPAGLVVAGLFSNPVGYAHAVTFTTHKTICGPRGAVIISTDEEVASKIDTAVFPGEQGGPHINNIAAKAVIFKIAATEKFRQFQRKIVENAKFMSDALQKNGMPVAYGGTSTHLMLVDLNKLKTKSNLPMKGGVAANILDLCGIVCNSNTLPGDPSSAHASGIRFGTPIITQRGMGKHEVEKIAELISKVLINIHPFNVIVSTGTGGQQRGKIKMRDKGFRGRGRIEMNVMDEVKNEVVELIESADNKVQRKSGYPHYLLPEKNNKVKRTCFYDVQSRLNARFEKYNNWEMPSVFNSSEEELNILKTGAGIIDFGNSGIFEITGERAGICLEAIMTNNIGRMKTGEVKQSLMLNSRGKIVDDVMILHIESNDKFDRYIIDSNCENADYVKRLLRSFSDGYIIFDDEDLYKKVDGPVIVESMSLTKVSIQGPRASEIAGKINKDILNMGTNNFKKQAIYDKEIIVSKVQCADGNLRFDFYMPAEEALKLFSYFLNEGAKPVGMEAFKKFRAESHLPVYETEIGEIEASSIINTASEKLFSMTKPYFIGQNALKQQFKTEGNSKKYFEYKEPEQPLKKTCLYEEHLKLTDKKLMVPFAGWIMPVWYSGIKEEHMAVRNAAGLFDVTHMGIFSFKGKGTMRFLDLITTNYVYALKDGQCQYSYILDSNAHVLDDILVYRISHDEFMMVVNAANHDKIKAWLKAVVSKEFIIDNEMPFKIIDEDVVIKDLKENPNDPESRVDVALQGPNSVKILYSLIEDKNLIKKINKLKRFEFTKASVSGINMIISKTGYTGENTGFEFYLHPKDGSKLWNLLLEKGKEYGIKPAGLGSRDSTRTEAGFPLYGHELAGHYDISPTEAGYGSFVKLHKPFFIGRKPYLDIYAVRPREAVRFKIHTAGARMARTGNVVVSKRGEYIGNVTSCTLVDGVQIGIAYIDSSEAQEGSKLEIFVGAKEVKSEISKLGDKVNLSEEAVIVKRFSLK